MSQIIEKTLKNAKKNIKANTKAKEKTYWKSFDELAQTKSFQEQSEREFPSGASELTKTSGLDRRNFFKLMGASIGLAGISGCIRRPAQYILPYGRAPEQIIPGRALYYATAMNVGLNVAGLLVESHEGRPTKVEGNPHHPMSLGKTGIYHQASVLDLYDPERFSQILNENQAATLNDFKQHLKNILNKDGSKINGVGVLSPIMPSRTASKLKKSISSTGIKCYDFEAIHYDNVIKGVKSITGRKKIPYYRSIKKAKVILSLESDFLTRENGSLKSAWEYAQNRNPDKKSNRLYVLENSISSTGAVADHWASVCSGNLVYVIALVISHLYHTNSSLAYRFPATIINGIKGLVGTGKELIDQNFVDALCDDLLNNLGRSLITAGQHQSVEVHGLVYLLNQALGNIGNTVEYVSPKFYTLRSSLDDIKKLAGDIKGGKIKHLIVLGGDPIYSAPVDLGLADWFKKINVIHLTARPNETSVLANWVVPEKHYLESWGDLLAIDGTASVVQPLVEPLYESLSAIELLALLNGSDLSAYQLVKQTYGASETAWRKWLHDGIISRGQVNKEELALVDHGLSKLLKKAFDRYERDSIEISFLPDYSLYDGRFNNNGWLQELPDPVTKLTWDNAALLSSGLAKTLKVKTGEKIKITRGGHSLTLPILIMPGVADKTIVIPQGYGASKSGVIGQDVGFSIKSLRQLKHFDLLKKAKVTKAPGKHIFANVQDHWSLNPPARGFAGEGEARPLYLETKQEIYEKGFEVLKQQAGFRRLMKIKRGGKEVAFGSDDLQSLWEEQKYNETLAPHQWGMTIDLGKCTGCNACTIACQSENNIPIVGKKEVLNGREMHWIRIDRYFQGSPDAPQVALQPVTCHQCENAPCEQVCPVAATTHNSEGLNDMAYNRCIGTRYCANNCPYKVRRFNFFDFHQTNPQSVKKDRNHLFDLFKEPAQTVKMQFNPDVTVRMRGVMEKCTFCVQRINEAKIIAKTENKKLVDQEIQVACQQACPSGAIEFGNLLDKKSQVVANKKLVRNYEMLAELNTKPRLSYLAKVRNPHPNLG